MVVFSMSQKKEEEKKNINNDDLRFNELNNKISVIEEKLNELTAQNKYYESLIKELKDTISGFINEEEQYDCDGDCENCSYNEDDLDEKFEEAKKILKLFDWSEINDVNPVGLTVFEVIENDDVTACFLYSPNILLDYEFEEDSINELMDYLTDIYLDEDHCHHNMVFDSVNVIKISKEMFNRLTNAFNVYEKYIDLIFEDDEEEDEE